MNDITKRILNNDLKNAIHALAEIKIIEALGLVGEL